MVGWKRRGKDAEPGWQIEGISEAARKAAEDAASASGTPLEIWLCDTVLRASQEGADLASPESSTDPAGKTGVDRP